MTLTAFSDVLIEQMSNLLTTNVKKYRHAFSKTWRPSLGFPFCAEQGYNVSRGSLQESLWKTTPSPPRRQFTHQCVIPLVWWSPPCDLYAESACTSSCFNCSVTVCGSLSQMLSVSLACVPLFLLFCSHQTGWTGLVTNLIRKIRAHDEDQ